MRRARWLISVLAVVTATAVLAPVGTLAQDNPGFSGYPRPQFIATFGSPGPGLGQFAGPWDVAVGADGRVFVTDLFNSRVQVFSASGAYLDQWGSAGSGPGQFTYPNGIAVSPVNGTVYVVDSGNHRVQHFTASGEFLGTWGEEGSQPGQFLRPNGIDVAVDGSVYVVDSLNDRIQEFDADGGFVRSWGTRLAGASEPQSVALDEYGEVFITASEREAPPGTDTGARVLGFTADGVYQPSWSWGDGTVGPPLIHPVGIARIEHDLLVVDGESTSVVQRRETQGALLTQWGGPGATEPSLDYPYGIAVSPADGTVYIADFHNNRISRWGWVDARPDARIRVAGTTGWVGNNVYNGTGVGQKVSSSAPRLGRARYVISIQNDAIFPDRFRLSGSAGDRPGGYFDGRWYTTDGRDITDQVARFPSTFRTPLLQPGEKYSVVTEVSVSYFAPPGAVMHSNLIAWSVAQDQWADKVKFNTTRR